MLHTTLLIVPILLLAKPTAAPKDVIASLLAEHRSEVQAAQPQEPLTFEIEIPASLLWSLTSGLTGQQGLESYPVAHPRTDNAAIEFRNLENPPFQQPSQEHLDAWKAFAGRSFPRENVRLTVTVERPAVLPGPVLAVSLLEGRLTGPLGVPAIELRPKPSSFQPSFSVFSDARGLCDAWVSAAKSQPLPKTCLDLFSPPTSKNETQFDTERRRGLAIEMATSRRASKPAIIAVTQSKLSTYDFKRKGYAVSLPEVIGYSEADDLKMVTKPKQLFLKVAPDVAENELSTASDQVFLVIVVKTTRIYQSKEAARLGYPRPYMTDPVNEVHVAPGSLVAVSADGRLLGELK